MEVMPIIFSSVVIVLAVILSVVGVQFILILMEIRKTLKKANQTIDLVESKFNSVMQPFLSFGGMAAGMGTGLKLFETFVNWLQRNKEIKK